MRLEDGKRKEVAGKKSGTRCLISSFPFSISDQMISDQQEAIRGGKKKSEKRENSKMELKTNETFMQRKDATFLQKKFDTTIGLKNHIRSSDPI